VIYSVKNLLIIYPHWPPSNLTGVHRPRLIANYIEEFDWHPIVLTVSPEYYEEEPDPEISRVVSKEIEVVYTRAYRITKPRMVGDIGLRAFPFLLESASKIIKSHKVDFVWIPIPSFYTSLLGRILHEKFSIPYGIDYIDPWVRDIHNRTDWRSKLSLQLAKWLEPVAVKKASLLSGVSETYYRPVIERNFKSKTVDHVGMPYGFDAHDHEIILENFRAPWANINDCHPFVYAGAFLPNAHYFIKTLFKIIKQKVEKGIWDKQKHLFFIGTGKYVGNSIDDYAREYNISFFVHEIRERLPYLHILNILSSAYVVMAIGSTEQHYTASKIFQTLLSKRPVFAIFHHESSAVSVLKECKAEKLLVEYVPELGSAALEVVVSDKLDLILAKEMNWQPELYNLNKYSARASAKALVDKLNDLV
jgi:hypothetical protein